MKTLTLDPADIELGPRHRALDSEAVDRIAKSIADIGLKQPISIRVVEEMEIDGHMVSGVPLLVAGAHRLAAIKQLGWDRVECLEVEGDALSAELWEIAENLHRCDLTKEQRDEHIRRYAELLEARKAAAVVSGQVVQKLPGRPKETAAIIAEDTGLSQRTVRRALNPRPVAVEPPKEVFDVHEQARRRLMGAWNAAAEEDRQWFRDWIDGPIMDAAL